MTTCTCATYLAPADERFSFEPRSVQAIYIVSVAHVILLTLRHTTSLSTRIAEVIIPSSATRLTNAGLNDVTLPAAKHGRSHDEPRCMACLMCLVAWWQIRKVSSGSLWRHPLHVLAACGAIPSKLWQLVDSGGAAKHCLPLVVMSQASFFCCMPPVAHS